MNKTILIGRLTKDPEVRQTNGTTVCKFTLAVNRPFKKGETDFINCVAFGKTGETIAQYITKGRQLAVTGRIQTGSYDDKEGIKRYTTDVIVDGFDFIDSGNGGQATNNSNEDEDMTPVLDDGDLPF